MGDNLVRIESEIEINAYLQDLRYALDHGAQVLFQRDREVDRQRDKAYTNSYTVSQLFPDENPVTALKRELKTLKVADYLQTVKDRRFPNRSEFREFGKVYNVNDEVYIKVRVELLSSSSYAGHSVFVMSFHFAITPFSMETFPYRK